jgi:RNA polymerase sigma-70 factor (ECF subfamily)
VLTKIEDCIPALRRYALAVLPDRQDADDLVHDCLVRGLDKLHTRRDDGDIRAWLFAIMHNLYVTRWRRARARRGAEALEAAAGTFDRVPCEQEAMCTCTSCYEN